MIEIKRYNVNLKLQWDNLVADSKNGTFLFYRDYMDYHSERFVDCSFLIYKKGKIEGLIPGNLNDCTFYSHQGLTYGGLISSYKITTIDVLEIFNLLNNELRNIGILNVIYKPIPLIYHQIPAQEDIYALFLNKAEKIGCNISSTIFQNRKLRFIESRRSGIRKSIREGVQITESKNFAAFWKILEENIENKYNTRPVHSLHEMELLNNKFPDNIRLFIANKNGSIVAGSIIYLMRNILHVQYISANIEGKNIGAIDLMFDYLINNKFRDIQIFDFGQSTENMGNRLNENLIFQKEGFGGRGTVYEIFKYNL